MGLGSPAALVTHPHLPGPAGGRPVHLNGARQEEGRGGGRGRRGKEGGGGEGESGGGGRGR